MKDATDVPRPGVDGSDLTDIHADEVGRAACVDGEGHEEFEAPEEHGLCARGGGGVVKGVSGSR